MSTITAAGVWDREPLPRAITAPRPPLTLAVVSLAADGRARDCTLIDPTGGMGERLGGRHTQDGARGCEFFDGGPDRLVADWVEVDPAGFEVEVGRAQPGEIPWQRLR